MKRARRLVDAQTHLTASQMQARRKRATSVGQIAMGEIPSICPPHHWAALWLTAPRRFAPLVTRSVLHRNTPSGWKPGPANCSSEIADFCRASGLAELTFGRAAINDGKLVSRLRNGGRDHDPHLGPPAGVHGDKHAREPTRPGRWSGARDRAAPPRPGRATHRRRTRAAPARSAAQFPLLRQPPEISALRQYLQREMGGREPGRRWSSPTSIRARRPCASSTPAWATAPCSRA